MKTPFLLRIIGCLLSLGLVLWIGFTLWQGELSRPVPKVLGFGSQFDANPKLPVEKINSAFDGVDSGIKSHTLQGNRFNWLGKLADWLSFALTSIITLIAGYQGYTAKPEETPATLAANLIAKEKTGEPTTGSEATVAQRPKSVVSWIGLLAAAASISIVLTSRLQAEAQMHYKQAEELLGVATLARKELISAKTSEDAEIIIQNLNAKSLRK